MVRRLPIQAPRVRVAALLTGVLAVAVAPAGAEPVPLVIPLAIPLVIPLAGDDSPRKLYEAALEEGEATLVESLEDLADWCKRKRLLREADICFRQILEYEPDHEEAREGLRYRRLNGVWVQQASYRQPRNFSKSAMELFPRKRRAVLDPYKQLVFDLNDANKDTVSLERRESALEKLLEILPDDVDVRARLGETLVDGEWKLFETERTLRERKRIAELARTCVATAPDGEPAEPTPLESQLQLDWNLILETPYLRVAGTVEEEEVREVMRVTQGAGEFFRTLLRNDTLPRVGFTVFLLRGDAEKQVFLNNHPRVKPRDLPYFNSLLSAGIPGTSQTAEWSPTREDRLDRSTRQTVGALLKDTYGITVRKGWAWEGIGAYLTYQLVGTRKTYFIRPGKYGGDPNEQAVQKQLLTRLMHPDADWLEEARLFFRVAGNRVPKLGILMGRPVDSMSAQDLLWSYVFATFLLEGWPEKTPEFLQLIGGPMPPSQAVRQVFEMELPRLDQRILRWLEEIVG